MTTEDIIIHIFYIVDEQMKAVKRVPQTHLYPSEIVTIGVGSCGRLAVDDNESSRPGLPSPAVSACDR